MVEHSLHGQIDVFSKVKAAHGPEQSFIEFRQVIFFAPEVREDISIVGDGDAPHHQCQTLEEVRVAAVESLCVVDILAEVVLHVEHVVLCHRRIALFGHVLVFLEDSLSQRVDLRPAGHGVVAQVIEVSVADDEGNVGHAQRLHHDGVALAEALTVAGERREARDHSCGLRVLRDGVHLVDEVVALAVDIDSEGLTILLQDIAHQI